MMIRDTNFHIPKIGKHFFLVDPLDGTKEFLSKNGEFTINIAEIVDGKPVRAARSPSASPTSAAASPCSSCTSC